MVREHSRQAGKRGATPNSQKGHADLQEGVRWLEDYQKDRREDGKKETRQLYPNPPEPRMITEDRRRDTHERQHKIKGVKQR